MKTSQHLPIGNLIPVPNRDRTYNGLQIRDVLFHLGFDREETANVIAHLRSAEAVRKCLKSFHESLNQMT